MFEMPPLRRVPALRTLCGDVSLVPRVTSMSVSNWSESLSSPRSLGRWLTRIENGEEIPEAARQAGEAAWRIGVTGPPGVGKSVLLDRLVEHWTGQGRRVGALLVDPSSPITRGAILGDRIRLRVERYGDRVFVRSMATRGHAGGTAARTLPAALALAAAGYDPVLIESVGVGQTEVGIRHVAGTVLLVVGPGQGDEVQMLKAGIFEIAHVFAVNKSDQPGAERMAALLQENLTERPGGWRPPVCLISALNGTGVKELVDALESSRPFR